MQKSSFLQHQSTNDINKLLDQWLPGYNETRSNLTSQFSNREKVVEDVTSEELENLENERLVDVPTTRSQNWIESPQFVEISKNFPTNSNLEQIANWSISVEDLWDLDNQSRVKLARFWVESYQSLAIRIASELAQKQKSLISQIKDINTCFKFDILQNADIVGMTTTGCSLNKNILDLVKPSIVIVEESAEILESCLVTCLHPSIQHLILIGDHLQLRPTVSSYELVLHHKMDISLFERMINNKISHETLLKQCR